MDQLRTRVKQCIILDEGNVTSLVLLQPFYTAYVWRSMEMVLVFEACRQLGLTVSTKLNISVQKWTT